MKEEHLLLIGEHVVLPGVSQRSSFCEGELLIERPRLLNEVAAQPAQSVSFHLRMLFSARSSNKQVHPCLNHSLMATTVVLF